MKKIIALFAILAFANCSTFLRNLADCEAATDDALAALKTDKTKCEACDAKFTAEDTEASTPASCACPQGEKLEASVGCRRKCTETSAIASANTAGYCKSCSGTWSGTACTCASGTRFTPNVGCEKIECTIKDAETIKAADNDEELCKACGLTFDSSKTDKCSCPESGENIPTETLCKYCKKDWKDSKCSGFNLKIAYALFAVLFLL